jgi:predicted phosphoribosyltransferase
MDKKKKTQIFDVPQFRNRSHVFLDREEAGKVLASMLGPYRESDTIVLAIPAGGLAVAVVIAKDLNLTLDLAIVSKITLPWNTEAGYGAVAFDGTVMLNEELLPRLHLTPEEIQQGISKTKEKIHRRVKKLRGDRPMPDFRRSIILVDDGLASGFTLRTAIEALRKAGNRKIILAIPTAHVESLQAVAERVHAVYCPNIRRGPAFAVADAYEHWRDLDEEEVARLLEDFIKMKPKTVW